MQAVFETLEQYPGSREVHSLRGMGAKVANWFTEIFGCSHKELSRPFSRHGESYRVCIACGAHQRFDAANWSTRGDFYYRVASTADLRENNVSAVRRLAIARR